MLLSVNTSGMQILDHFQFPFGLVFPCRPNFKWLQKNSSAHSSNGANSNCTSRCVGNTEVYLTDPAVYKASVDHPNITFTAGRSKFGGKIPKAVVDGKTSPGKIDMFYR